MNIALPLERMTVADKLRTMETLWEDLCRKSDELRSPSWHGGVLSERARRLEKGKEPILGWDEAKKKIRRSAR